ncbi:MAG: hypothetical protein COA79_03290 [Planctomycetota bacterium]|nr:MAG: hypothetical protein COA79_03290 [Planctomycetota bacterium]
MLTLKGFGMTYEFQGTYTNENLNKIAFPLGGMGAGMICLEGYGGFTSISLRHKPEILHQPLMFAAISVKNGNEWQAKILQGKTPDWKIMFPFSNRAQNNQTGSGGRNTTMGFPYFKNNSFESQFPFATINLSDPDMPLSVKLIGWSPFIPGNADDSSLPTAFLEYEFTNESPNDLEAVFSFAAENFMIQNNENPCCPEGQCNKPKEDHRVIKIENGFVLHQAKGNGNASRQGDFSVSTKEAANINCQWFRGGWFDHQTRLWDDIATGKSINTPDYEEGKSSPGGTLSIPIKLAKGKSRKVKLVLTWHVPESELSRDACNTNFCNEFYQPWYASKFKNILKLNQYIHENHDLLYKKSKDFSTQMQNKKLPAAVKDAVTANLSILKSPTLLRETSGRIWAWEGSCDSSGCCSGSCTHVWNYAQALPHLFPELERSLRETEFEESQNESGHQNFRSSLPIQNSSSHNFHAAADGQLGGIMKVYRDWKIGGDNSWLLKLWPKIKSSLNYCIETWDPTHQGLISEPHHNTYDIEFWGADGMCTSFYLGALKAGSLLAKELKEDNSFYQELYLKGRKTMEVELWNGEYFIQNVQTKGLSADFNPENAEVYSTEEQTILKEEGPKYQYGDGCLSDGAIGAWMAEVCGLGEILDPKKVKSHLLAVFKYNFKKDFSNHANPQRPTYCMNDEAGLLLCTWPRGNRLSLPFPYSEEVWTGIEYQVASHLAIVGEKEKCLEIVQAVRKRYNGISRNPFNEFECGHWYARAMSSYALLQAYDE